MKEVKTRDGSKTYWNEEFGEHYHSHTVGAIEEGIVKFAEPCGIKDGMKILDICFGLGYNTLAAMKLSKRIEVMGLENDRKIIDMIRDVEVPDEFSEDYNILRKMSETLSYDKDGLKIRILLGDAREMVRDVGDGFDAVFMDPFSPKKCPVLWTKEFFDEIYKRMNKGGVLATYSCATVVRKNLAAAGFMVKDGPVFGRKSPATVAMKR